MSAASPRTDVLPAAARKKLLHLHGQAEDARFAAQNAANRMGDIKRGLAYGGDTPPPSAAAMDAEWERLGGIRKVQDDRHRELSDLTTSINNWLMSLPRGIVLEPARIMASPELESGQTLPAAIEAIRDEITGTMDVPRSVELAPLPKADLKLLARQYVAGLARRGTPTVRAERDGLVVKFSDPSSFTAVSPETPATMMAWLHGPAMVVRLEAMIDALPDNPNAMKVERKAERLTDLKGSIEFLERREERMIEAAHAAGFDVLRRPDADPMAVLGVIIAKLKRVERKDKAA